MIRGRVTQGSPARPGPLLAYFASRALVGATLGLPLSVAVAGVVGPQPAGDAVLWAPGGLLLLETVRLLEPAFAGLAWTAAAVGLVASFALLVPLAALIASMGRSSLDRRGPPAGAHRLLAVAAARFGTLALIMGMVLLLQAVALSLWTVFATILLEALTLQPSSRAVAKLLLVGAGLGVPWLLGMVQDIARTLAVQHRLGALDALAGAVAALRGTVGRASLACAWRGALALAALAGSAGLTLAIGCRTTAQLAGAIAVQLAALLLAVALRASWFRWITDRLPVPVGSSAEPLPSDTPVGSDMACPQAPS